MLSAVGSSLAGQSSATLTSFGLRTPAARAFCHDAHRASGSARSRSPRSMTSRYCTPNTLIANARWIFETHGDSDWVANCRDASRADANVERCGSARMCGGTPKMRATSLTEKLVDP